MAAAKKPTRLRKVSCESVDTPSGWHAVGWQSVSLRARVALRCDPLRARDLAYLGLIGQDDVPAPMWTAICRENGWEDLIVRKGAAAKSWTERRKLIRMERAGHCAYPGCGRWVADGADRCGAGHPQHDHAASSSSPPSRSKEDRCSIRSHAGGRTQLTGTAGYVSSRRLRGSRGRMRRLGNPLTGTGSRSYLEAAQEACSTCRVPPDARSDRARHLAPARHSRVKGRQRAALLLAALALEGPYAAL